MISLTIFNSVYDNKTHRRMDLVDWPAFKQLLYGLSTGPGYKPKKGEFKKGSPLITPAIFTEGTTRSNKNVVSWAGWAALDVDDYEGSVEDALGSFAKVEHLAYSSASSTVAQPKFRMVFPLTEHIPAEKIRHFWFALNKEFNSLGDPQTKDLGRMYYVPAKYPSATYQFIQESVEGATRIDPNALMSRHDYITGKELSMAGKLPPHLLQKVMEYRQSQLTNRDIRWTSYRDCEFVNRRLVAEYRAISKTGWYLKMYAIMVSIAANAIRKGYPITSTEISDLCREIDRDSGNWYENRPFETEADRAITFVLQSK